MRMRRHAPKVQRTKAKRNKQHQRERACTDVTIRGPSIFGGVGCAQSMDPAPLEGLTVHNPWTQHLWRGWLCTIRGPSIFGGVDCAPHSQFRHFWWKKKARLLICIAFEFVKPHANSYNCQVMCKTAGTQQMHVSKCAGLCQIPVWVFHIKSEVRRCRMQSATKRELFPGCLWVHWCMVANFKVNCSSDEKWLFFCPLLPFLPLQPVNMYPPNSMGFHDTYGNVWEWSEDHFNGLTGFKTNFLYDDFSSPCFDGRHTMIQVRYERAGYLIYSELPSLEGSELLQSWSFINLVCHATRFVKPSTSILMKFFNLFVY